MITASDVYAEYLVATSDEEVGIHCNKLARDVDGLIMRFESMRQKARNALWASVMLLLCACTARTISAFHFDAFGIVLALILSSGVLAVPYTVLSFRHAFRPVMKAYHGEQQTRECAVESSGASSIDDYYATRLLA